MLDQITPVVLTLDESPNIGRVLERLTWARDVVVVDSHSTDDTPAIVSRFPNARLFPRKFDDHAAQWNFGITKTAISTEWVLALDADFIVPDELLEEVRNLSPGHDVAGYQASFRYCIDGRALRSAAYPPVTVLYRRPCAEYLQDGHTQRVRVTGQVLSLRNPVLHDDRKSLHRWLGSQSRYQKLEAAKLARMAFSEASIPDRVRKLIVVAPLAMFFYCMFVKGNVLDGRAGLFYALQRSIAEAILSLYLLEARVAVLRSGE